MITEPLPELDYLGVLDSLTVLCRTLSLLPLEQMQHANERMQTLGAFLEPTAYLHGGAGNLHDQRRVIDAARALQIVVHAIQARGGGYR